jgi:drug/metabolite transporter superfamily protein YnfA
MVSGQLSSPLIYLFVAIIGIIGGVGDVLLYKWAKLDQLFWLMAACGVWLVYIVLFGLFLRLEYFSFSIAVVVATVIHLLLSLLWGFFFTDVKLNRIEWAGLILGILAVVLLEIGHTLNPDQSLKK